MGLITKELPDTIRAVSPHIDNFKAVGEHIIVEHLTEKLSSVIHISGEQQLPWSLVRSVGEKVTIVQAGDKIVHAGATVVTFKERKFSFILASDVMAKLDTSKV